MSFGLNKNSNIAGATEAQAVDVAAILARKKVIVLCCLLLLLCMCCVLVVCLRQHARSLAPPVDEPIISFFDCLI